MDKLPELGLLSIAEKDDLIRALFAQVAALTAKVTELEGRLALNSQNSSKPPSSDGLNKPKPKSQRKAGQNPTGGQKGHTGHTLKKVAQPDHIETHSPPSHCNACHRPLPSCLLPPASCLLPPASCLLPPASCLLPPASCLLPWWSKPVRCSTFRRCVTK
ncbi:MAG: DUF6444 domain-containing protein [Sulfuricella sp.]